MEIPMLDVLKEKNIFSGSQGDFRFKVMPENGVIKAVAYKTYCLEYCRENNLPLQERDFEMTPDGMDELSRWLNDLAAQTGESPEKTEK